MSISDGLDPIFFRRKMEKKRSVKEKMEEEVFISRQTRQFPFIDMFNVLFPSLIVRMKNYVSRQEKV